MNAADHMDPDEPLTLQEACDLLFRGKITPSTLRAEFRRGNLAIERIGRQDFVTLNAIKEMRRKCRAKGEDRTCGSDQNDETNRDSSRTKASGSLSEARNRSARAAVKTIAQALKESSQTTSRDTTSPTQASVIPLK